MAIKLKAFLAHSLDGKIAGPNGDLTWLDQANLALPEGEDCGFAEFMAGVDALLMGRKTLEKVLTFGFWPYTKPVYVLGTHWSPEALAAQGPYQLWSMDLAGALQRLQELGYSQIYVDGGTLISSALELGVLDEMILTQIPVALGSGVDLLTLSSPISMKLLYSHSWSFGYVQNHFQVIRA